MTEKELLQATRDLARLRQWLEYHTHDSRRSSSGFPDLVLVRGERIVWVELKSATGKVRPEQQVWLEALVETGAEVYVWRPIDWTSGDIDTILR